MRLPAHPAFRQWTRRHFGGQRQLNHEGVHSDRPAFAGGPLPTPAMHHLLRRPSPPPPLQRTARDDRLLRSIRQHRLLLAEHLHWLHGTGVSLRVVQHRLRLLWAAGYLDRIIIRPDVPGERDDLTGRALYCLAARGAVVLGDTAQIPHTIRQNLRGFATLRHHLVATDLLVALQAAMQRLKSWRLGIQREEELRHRLATTSHPKAMPVVVPDAAFSLHGPGHSVPQSFAVEVVRAGTKGGNGSVVRRLQTYRKALRAGSLKALYGIEWLHAVVVLTPSEQRARRLASAARAADIPDSFTRFGWWQTSPPDPHRTRLRPDTVATAWLLGRSGAAVGLLPELVTHLETQPPFNVCAPKT